MKKPLENNFAKIEKVSLLNKEVKKRGINDDNNQKNKFGDNYTTKVINIYNENQKVIERIDEKLDSIILKINEIKSNNNFNGNIREEIRLVEIKRMINSVPNNIFELFEKNFSNYRSYHTFEIEEGSLFAAEHIGLIWKITLNRDEKDYKECLESLEKFLNEYQ